MSVRRRARPPSNSPSSWPSSRPFPTRLSATRARGRAGRAGAGGRGRRRRRRRTAWPASVGFPTGRCRPPSWRDVARRRPPGDRRARCRPVPASVAPTRRTHRAAPPDRRPVRRRRVHRRRDQPGPRHGPGPGADRRESLRTLGSRASTGHRERAPADALQERQRLLEQLSTIQRAIARRAPLQQILDTITIGARELLGDDVVGLRLRDSDDPEMLLLVSQCGISGTRPRRRGGTTGPTPARPARRCCATTWSSIQRTPSSPHVVARPGRRARGPMAAPVHENGTVVGGLVVGSYGTPTACTASTTRRCCWRSPSTSASP